MDQDARESLSSADGQVLTVWGAKELVMASSTTPLQLQSILRPTKRRPDPRKRGYRYLIQMGSFMKWMLLNGEACMA
jgi:hypothetical protein